jgi:ADP-ribose pyrophosphatase YjhB (NUDIX family)
MQYLVTLYDKDIFPTVVFDAPSEYEKRITVKAIVKNDTNRFAFITSASHGCYLLPGGGAESDDLETEIKRECVEEIGFEIDIIRIIRQTQEFRSRLAKEYVTTCFFAKTTRNVMGDFRTEDEKEAQLQVEWFTVDEAKKILSEQVERVRKGDVNGYELPFNIVRDHLFFTEFLRIYDDTLI